ncbi:unnamed protein product [Brugia timori]|uniref:Uncharacterized protein n=1 Tax=Brugia timori TaxID=42155 RepID=A0A0R3QZZ4_9BILA|nr:unnamed protein product [Brugia timori]
MTTRRDVMYLCHIDLVGIIFSNLSIKFSNDNLK